MKEVILDFLQACKEKKIKDKVKSGLSEEEKQEILQELEAEFIPKNWIENAAKRTSKLTIASHPSKFSNPYSKTSSIIAKSQKENDGYLRSGNVEYELDVFGNAALLDAYKFLILKTKNDKTILEHLEQDDPEIKEIFCQFGLNYQENRKAFLSIKETSKSIITDALVKQVYFPVDDNYHLLSILTPSGILAKAKEKIDQIRFFDDHKEVRKLHREGKFYEGEKYDDLLKLTQMKYGGSNPQNLSYINSKNKGIAYLLPSLPPKFQKRETNLPNSDFFKNVLRDRDFKENFDKLHKLIKDTRNNKPIREYRQELVEALINKVLERVIAIQENYPAGWSREEKYDGLKKSQKIWLDGETYKKEREDDDWVDEVAQDFANWIFDTYERLHKKSFEMLGDGEFSYFKNEIIKIIEEINTQTKNAIL